jgi:hypothetical protein
MATKTIKQKLMDARELIDDADFDLMMIEDYTHGEEGKKITEIRGVLQTMLRTTESLLLKIDIALKATE